MGIETPSAPVAPPCEESGVDVPGHVIEEVVAPPVPEVRERVVEKVVEVQVPVEVRVPYEVEKIVYRDVEKPVVEYVPMPIDVPMDPETWAPPRDWTSTKRMDFVRSKFPEVVEAYRIYYDGKRGPSVTGRAGGGRGRGGSFGAPPRCPAETTTVGPGPGPSQTK